jgi:hypothetical protein
MIEEQCFRHSEPSLIYVYHQIMMMGSSLMNFEFHLYLGNLMVVIEKDWKWVGDRKKK